MIGVRIGIIMLALALPSIGLAISDTFTVGVRISDDVTPPTIPSPVTATPVAPTQINIVWGASTDNDILAGYKLFRDAIQIATTTLTNYSDTGLTASTTYSYFVQAFDDTGNISTSSVTVSTTTLQAPPVTPTTTPEVVDAASYGFRAQTTDVTVTPNTTSATVEFTTNTFVRYILKWGKTASYELGSVRSQVYKKNHQTLITGLEPGTRYQYQIIGIMQNGREYVLEVDNFTTTQNQIVTPPQNVLALTATPSLAGVTLEWLLPGGTGISKIRIVRNYRFYPTDPSAGYIAYEGIVTRFFDSSAWDSSARQYYTVFTYDTEGRVSSGAVVMVDFPGDPVGGLGGDDDQTNEDTTVDPGDDVVASSTDPVTELWDSQLRFQDLEFRQADRELRNRNQVVVGDDMTPITAALPVGRVTTDLKAITIKLENNTQSQRFLLRLNPSGTAYEAVLPVLPEATYTVSVSIYNYLLAASDEIRGTLIVEGGQRVIQQNLFTKWWWVWPPFVILLLYIIWRLLREDNRLG